MKKLLGIAAVGLLLTASGAFAAEEGKQQPGSAGMSTPAGQPGGQIVKGEILKIDGQNYTVKDKSGKEVKFAVDKETQLQGPVKEGDSIEAKIAQDGTADSVKKASDKKDSPGGGKP
jgi:uncharacterized protein YdeI (BOF family)